MPSVGTIDDLIMNDDGDVMVYCNNRECFAIGPLIIVESEYTDDEIVQMAIVAWNRRVPNTEAQTPQPNWDEAPDWAQWWSVEPDGNTNWHEQEPYVTYFYWYSEGNMERVIGGFVDIPLGTDWRLLKVPRPQDSQREGVQSNNE